jgi:hypothetical protein
MNTANYLNLILSGYFKNPDTLKRFLTRAQKIEKRDNLITEDEFYDNCKDVVLTLKKDIYFKYNNHKSELLKVLSFKKSKEIDITETQKQYNTNDLSHFTINLLHKTDNKFGGFLQYSEIIFIENSIKQLVLKNEVKELFESQQTKIIKPDEVKKELKDFFNSDIKPETIKLIEDKFRTLIGKRLAYLIYLLDVEFDMINYSLKSNNNSRKHFVESLKNEKIKMQGVNYYFTTYTTKLKSPDFDKDNDFIKIKKALSNSIK